MTASKPAVPAGRSVDTSRVRLSDRPGVPDTAGMKLDTLSPATDVAASGALIEPEIVERIDTAHPAVDDKPRAGQSVDANRIDFNDPTITDSEAVARNLKVTPAAESKDD